MKKYINILPLYTHVVPNAYAVIFLVEYKKYNFEKIFTAML